MAFTVRVLITIDIPFTCTSTADPVFPAVGKLSFQAGEFLDGK
jgi:hypothetical protein